MRDWGEAKASSSPHPALSQVTPQHTTLALRHQEPGSLLQQPQEAATKTMTKYIKVETSSHQTRSIQNPTMIETVLTEPTDRKHRQSYCPLWLQVWDTGIGFYGFQNTAGFSSAHLGTKVCAKPHNHNSFRVSWLTLSYSWKAYLDRKFDLSKHFKQ